VLVLLPERRKKVTPEQMKQAVEEFQQIYKDEFGVELSSAEATEKAHDLLDLTESIALAN
jgi:hypothetical protein